MAEQLTRAEMAAIYRRLRPDRIYRGQVPEAWLRAVLIRQIGIALAEDARKGAGRG